MLRTTLLRSALTAAILAVAGASHAHDGRLHLAQADAAQKKATELKQFGDAEGPPPVAASTPVPLWESLTGHRFESSTRSPEAQAYIDQAVMLTFGFNHAEAGRSFARAAEIDPSCAICHWGQALVLGPNINAPMDPSAIEPALAALARAQALAETASPREQALIDALASRYAPQGEADRADLDAAYAQAMADVAAAYPEDDDIAVLYAEALMDLSPWDFWADEGATPKGATAEVVATLERVLARNPDHIGAIHLYIHTVEASTTPERAEPYADRLARMELDAGHLVHMPSHIYYRIGRYEDSLDANVRAVATDEGFFAAVPPAGIYAAGYYPHNIHFLLVSAQMAGDGPTAIEAATKLAATVSDEAAQVAPGFVLPIKVAPLYAHAQFSDPETILALPRPSGDFAFADAIWRYARGVAHAASGDVEAARAEREALGEIARTGDLAGLEADGVPAKDILAIAGFMLDGRIAQARDDAQGAVRAFEEAAAIEAALPYMEPRYWYAPVGQTLGAALVDTGDLDRAEAAFEDSLALAPNNGWALYGLSRVHHARGDLDAARETEEALRAAWTGDLDALSLERL